MGTYPVPVDVEELVVSYLRAHTGVGALLGERIYFSRLPEATIYPLAVVHRFGGSDGRQGWRDRARIQLDVWADTKTQAREAAATCYAAMLDLPGIHATGVVTGVEDFMGLTWAPDPDVNGRPRYVFAEIVSCHPNP